MKLSFRKYVSTLIEKEWAEPDLSSAKETDQVDVKSDVWSDQPKDDQVSDQVQPEGEGEVEGESQQDSQDQEDPDKQGVLRKVKGAHLVYKRKSPDGDFEELWVFNTGGGLQDEIAIRKSILAGTDIPPSKTKSPDDLQSYEIVTLGNAQLLHIKGLPQ